MAAENHIDLKIVDDLTYKLNELDIERGTKVVFINESKAVGGSNYIRHYRFLGTDGQLLDIKSYQANYGYAVFSELTGKNIGQLRN